MSKGTRIISKKVSEDEDTVEMQTAVKAEDVKVMAQKLLTACTEMGYEDTYECLSVLNATLQVLNDAAGITITDMISVPKGKAATSGNSTLN